MDKIVSIKVYLTDLALDAEFSKVRGEVFPHNPPMGGITSHYGRSGLPRIVGADIVGFAPRGLLRAHAGRPRSLLIFPKADIPSFGSAER